MPLNPLWLRRQTTKFNGVSYPIQRAAAAIYTEQGKKETKKVIDFYMENASIMKKSLTALGFTVYGGENAPYVWMKTKNKMKSWDFFDMLLKDVNIVGTPGSGFGPACTAGRATLAPMQTLGVDAIDCIKCKPCRGLQSMSAAAIYSGCFLHGTIVPN